MALQSPTPAPSDPQSQRQPQVFEFTKRKKWADILISELPDTVLLILEADGQIQYVGPNAGDVLGWDVEDLSETDVLDIVNDDDKMAFNKHLQESLRSLQDLSCFARLKCKPVGIPGSEQNQKELLFEVRGRALYLPNDNECKCFFLVAKPYPSRNMAVLNTFLELKIENERLTQRLRDLKSQQDLMPETVDDPALPMSASTLAHPQFSTYEFSSSRDGAMQTPPASTTGTFSAMQTGFINSTVPSINARDEEGEDGGKKKKKKINGPAQQYVCVTCGRTDSPEWRKGPRGPKTLCNACGLRWAKRSKCVRTDDVPIPYVQGQGAHEDGARPSSSTSSSRSGRGAPVAHASLSVTPTEASPAISFSQPHQQNQGKQGRYDTQEPTPSPTHTSFSQSHQAPMASVPPAPASGHYVMQQAMPVSMHQPTSVHGFVQTQPQTQEQYQAVYDQYAWPMNHLSEGGYRY